MTFSSRFSAWFFRGKPLWLWLSITAIILALGWWFPDTLVSREGSDRLKWTGMAFQLIGLLVVFKGLDESRSLFEKRRIWQPGIEWVRDFPAIFKRPAVIGATINLDAVSSAATAGGVRINPQNRTLAERLTAVEERFGLFEEHVTRRFSEAHNNFVKKMDDEILARRTSDENIKSIMKNALIGSINLELGGAFYLLLGTIMTAIPEDLAAMITGIHKAIS